MIDDSMQEIVNDFIQEALELLDSLNENFIELEKNPEDKEILNTIFRAAHTVKGSAGFLGFQNIVELAHSAENILNKLRQGEITLTSEMTDYLLKTMDVLRSMIVTVSETGSEGEPPEGNTGLIKKLNELSEGIGGGSEKKTSAEVSNSNTAIAAPETQDKEVPNAAVADADKEKTKTVDSADKMPDSGKKKPRSLGDILLEDNLISKEELEEIYKEKEEEEHTAEKVTAVPEVSAEEIPHPSASAKAFQPAEEKQVSGKPAEEIKSNPVPQKPVSAAAAKPAFAVPTASPAAEIKETTIRVDIERLDNVMNLVGELVLARNRLFNISSKLEIKYADDDLSSTLAQVVAGLNLVTTDLQLAVMKTRMQI